MRFRLKQFWVLIKEAAIEWSKDRAPRLGAALAYYTIFSMVPLLIILIGIIGLVFGQEAAQSAILGHLRNVMGPESASAIQDMLQRANQPSTGIVSTIIATVTLLAGAAGFFGQLKDALNTVWGTEPKQGRGVWRLLKDNFLSFATLLGTGFLLLVSLVISTALAAFGKWFGDVLPLPEIVLQTINLLLAFLLIAGLFALIFKILPDARIAWSDVWVGGLLTSALFTIGKFAIALYLGKSNVSSAYGAAGSLVVVLVWVYYSVQILLYGAEFTEAYAKQVGANIKPTEEADVVTDKTRHPFNAGPQFEPRIAESHGEMRGTMREPHRHRLWLIAGTVAGLLIIMTNKLGRNIKPTEEADVVGDKTRHPLNAGPSSHAWANLKETSLSKPGPRRLRLWVIAGTVAGLLIIMTIVAAGSLLNGPAKRYIETEVGNRLPDYEIAIGALELQPFRLGIGMQDVIIRLRSHPEPPLSQIPNLTSRVRVFPLFTGTVDLHVKIEHPQLAATERQVDAVLHLPKKKEQVKQQAAAWQDTMRQMMPIRLSLSLTDGTVTYRSEPHVEPLELHQLEVDARNVTNRPADIEAYPSTLRVNARVADDSHVALDSRADFLAKPNPRIEGDLKVKHVALPALGPLTGKYNVQLRQGAIDLTAHLKYADPTTVVEVNDLLVDGAKVDYIHTARTKQEELQVKKGAEKAKEVHRDPSVVVKVSRGKILHSDVGFINKATSPDYRLFLSDLDLELQNFSNRPEEGLGTVQFTGSFMGRGPTEVKASFRPEKPNPDFKVLVRIVKTPVDRLNKVLEAHGHINASQGTFAFFSDMTVKNNHIDGYVKPFLKDVQVYVPEQDQDKTTKKLFEVVVNEVLDLFRSTPTGQVATKTDISGPLENPKTSTWQILEKLVENAFFKAILPGFEGQPHESPA
jgi:YihY family inner membrane protein